MKFVVVLVVAGAAAFLGALVCIVASVYPPSPSPDPTVADLPLSSRARDNGTESPVVVAHAGPLGALQGGGGGGGSFDGPGDGLVGGGGGPKQFSFNRLICTPVPVGDCNYNSHHHHHNHHDVFRQPPPPPPGDDPWAGAGAGGGDRGTADTLRQTVVRQHDQILMDRRTIRELTGKLSECESDLEEDEEGGDGGPSVVVVPVAWRSSGSSSSSNRRFMAGDDVSSAAAATARAVEELERAIMDLKDRIEKLEAEIGPSALNLTNVPASTLGSGGGASNTGRASNSSPASPGSKTPSPPRPAAPGGRRPSAGPRPPPAQGGGRGGGKVTWKVGDVEGELERKIKLLEKERQTMRMENQGHRDNIDKGLDAVDHRLAELEHTMTEFSFPDGFVLSFPIRTNYMYGLVRKDMPEMYAFTACLWLKAKEGGIGTPFSYSVPAQPNELVLLQGAHNPVELLINDKVAQLPLSLLQDEWQHLCVSWTLRDGVWKAYQGGKMKGRGEGLAAWHPIKPGGVLVLGQEQDTLGGRFDASQALVGELSQFNLWDRVLKPAEVAALADCSSAILGSVAPWTDLDVDVYGGATKESLDPCHAAQRTNLKAPKQ